MERSYESAAALARRAVGPLADHLDAFVASLISQQYVAGCRLRQGTACSGVRPVAREAPSDAG